MSIACNVPSGDVLALCPRKSGRVVYLAAEDPVPVMIRRIHAIGKYVGQDAQPHIAENLVLEPIMGHRLDIMNDEHLTWLVEQSKGARLLVLDTLSRLHSLDENSNGDMARLVSILEYVAATTGAAVLYLHHVSKGSARDGQTDQQQAARGASALIDNARWCGFLAKMTSEESKKWSDNLERDPIGPDRRGYFLRFGVSKQNYDVPIEDRWYQRWTGGVLMPVELAEAKRDNGKKGGDRGRDQV